MAMLLQGVHPFIVFNGPLRPKAKLKTESTHRSENEKNPRQIIPKLQEDCIKYLEEIKVRHIVSPYEADAQLAYLARSGYIDVVMSQDSDMLVYGCPAVVCKMNLLRMPRSSHITTAKMGMGIEVTLERLLAKWNMSFESFQDMCILAGNSYTRSLPGASLNTAYKDIIQFGTLEKHGYLDQQPNYHQECLLAKETLRNQPIRHCGSSNAVVPLSQAIEE
ncbi:PIN domain-like protein [Zychaea mexicana]|uniref:PIN domain-like protein n=1 Tax=Zychaea mexicana TaxID=64656 RepID=UPI0022FF2600|nr:PIN domain-like protein [Zychaea mexicana]KAI9497066.1 PIN domain-like protein [Zychaea mexicana]